MSFTAQDVHEKITELTASGTPFELKDFNVAGSTRRGFAGAPPDLVQLLQAIWLAGHSIIFRMAVATACRTAVCSL